MTSSVTSADGTRDLPVISLVGLAHLTSHFFQLIVAPLFPWLKAEFGVSYTALGFVMTVIFVTSAASQAIAGFVVDRWGARVTLMGGLGVLILGTLGFGLSTHYSHLLASAFLIGLGNGVFHPVDYSLLNSHVSPRRLGPAYSVHGVTGSLGWACAPAFLVAIAEPLGWRAAVFSAAALPLASMLLLAGTELNPRADSRATAHAESPLFAFLKAPALWWCFAFFFVLAMAAGGIQNFSPTLVAHEFSLSRASAAASITVFMLASATGMLVGGWLVMRNPHFERNIAFAFTCSALSALLLGFGGIPLALAWVLIAVMGFGSGLSGPSRDMLIRATAPPGATGRVYGMVYSGLDFGIAVGPVLFGLLLDRGIFGEVFYAIAACWLLSLLAAARIAPATNKAGA